MLSTTTAPAPAVHVQLHRTRAARAGKAAARWLLNRCVEGYLRIDCVPTGPGGLDGHFQDSVAYTPCDYPFLIRCVNELRLRKDDVAFDVGCGLGRALCVIARRGVKRCVGIELSAELTARAARNIDSLRAPKAPAVVQVADAAFADYSGGTAFYLFNPFGEATLRAMLERIRESVENEPRAVRFVYLNPFFDHAFASAGWLRRVREVRSILSNTYASYWVSADRA